MKLYYSPMSPFARKVRISAMLLGLNDQIELVQTDVMSGLKTDYVRINPLLKVPALEMHTGEIIVNSPFICEYLNSLGLGRKILPVGPERWNILHDQAIADGAVDSSVLRIMETRRPVDKFDSKWDTRQKVKVESALEYFTNNFFRLKEQWTLREISVACLIGYLDFRFPKENWGAKYPRLWTWYKNSLEKHEFLRATIPHQV